MLASLPMYDLPELRWATDALWRSVAHRVGIAIELHRCADHTAAWRSPDLVLSQTCGYPFTHAYRAALQLVATPHYRAPGCNGPAYCSLIFARERRPLETFRGQRAAFNSPDSMSGMLALKAVFAPLARDGEFFSAAIVAGGHIGSLDCVRSGQADVCAVDAVTAALLARHRPSALNGLVEIGRSPEIPALPYVTALTTPPADVKRLRQALNAAIADPLLAKACDALLIAGITQLAPQHYDVILTLEQQIEAQGGLTLPPPPIHRNPMQ